MAPLAVSGSAVIGLSRVVVEGREFTARGRYRPTDQIARVQAHTFDDLAGGHAGHRDPRSSGLRARKAPAAAAPPARLTSSQLQIFDQAITHMVASPTATAGLITPPDILPSSKAPVSTVIPMSRPYILLFG